MTCSCISVDGVVFEDCGKSGSDVDVCGSAGDISWNILIKRRSNIYIKRSNVSIS
jgi:hypothetical protein